jgi:hypothetical protein
MDDETKPFEQPKTMQLWLKCEKQLQDKLGRQPTFQEIDEEFVSQICEFQEDVIKLKQSLDEARSCLKEFLYRHDVQPPCDWLIMDPWIDRARNVIK